MKQNFKDLMSGIGQVTRVFFFLGLGAFLGIKALIVILRTRIYRMNSRSPVS